MTNRIGQQFGNYRLIQLLGIGGYAEVYLGEHIHLKRHAAIKVLHTILQDKQKEDFLVEAQRLVDLSHPSIIQVFDFAIEGDLPYLIMEYAPNGTLINRHPRGSCLSLATVVSYVNCIVAPLQYLHNQNLVHRDVKPGNILVGKNQEILLSDFGIAAIAHQTNSPRMQGMAGTPLYMAPEQSQGMPQAASDQYALAVVVYEWLCGTPPFQGSAMAIGMQHLSTPPPSLCQRMPTVPPTLEQVILKALAKKPQQRFSTITEFAEALEEVSQPTKIVRAGLPIQRSQSPSPRLNVPTVAVTTPPQNEQPTSREDLSLRSTQPLAQFSPPAWQAQGHAPTEYKVRDTPPLNWKASALWQSKGLSDLIKAIPLIVLALSIVIGGFVTYLILYTKASPPQRVSTQPIPQIVLVEDTFARTDQRQWGTASDGHSQWAIVDANSQQYFSISNHAGMITGGWGPFDALIGTATANVDVTLIGTVNHFGSMDTGGYPVNFGIILRWQDPNHWYKAYIDGNHLFIVKWDNGQTTILGKITAQISEGVPQKLRFLAFGTELFAKVWRNGTTEPQDWMIDIKNPSYTTGQFGIRVVEQPATVISITSFSAKTATESDT